MTATDSEGRQIPQLPTPPERGIVKVPDAPPPPARLAEEPVEHNPVDWFGADDPYEKNFRPDATPVEVMPSDPSDSSAQASAISSGQADEHTPTPTGLEDAVDSPPDEPASLASVAKAKGPTKVPVPLRRTS